jgi:protein-S-isoprenylcysteine O-methyltransferase Ste14
MGRSPDLETRHNDSNLRVTNMDKHNFLELKIPPVAVFFIFAAIMWLLEIAVPTAGVSFPAKKPIAAGAAAVGGVFAGAGILSFLRVRTTLDPRAPGKAASLVTTGVYAITRNPMYLSLLFLLAGWAVYLSNFAALVALPFFVVYLNQFQILPEERALASLFGIEFQAYCNRVRRWL